jgi:ElaB/YqjD/DUF883 family membrane-anchored ribosome-binding protein
MSAAPEDPDRPVTGATEPVPEYFDGDKPPEEIEQDIARTRADLSETLDALEHRLSPRHLLEKGVDMLRDSMNDDFGRIGERIRANPLPLALIGAGIGWLVLSQTGGTRAVGEAARGVGRRVSDAAGRAGEMARGAAERAGELAGDAASRVKAMAGSEETSYPTGGESGYAYARPKTEGGFDERMAGYGAGYAGEARRRSDAARHRVGEAAHGARERLGDYAERAGERVSQVRGRAGELMEEHPLAVGALALFAGLLLGLMLPSTRVESEYLGETRERVMDEARELGRNAVDSAERVAGAAMDAAAETVREDAGGERPETGSRQAAKPKRATDPGSAKHEEG